MKYYLYWNLLRCNGMNILKCLIILNIIKINDPSNFDVDAFNSAITESGYETMNTSANQKSYDALPMCCKYDRNMVVYGSKSE